MRLKIISGDRVTIPKHIMRDLDLKVGDLIEVAEIKKHRKQSEGIILS